jgi:hypothetical protein
MAQQVPARMTYRKRFAKARRVAKTMRDKGVTRARVRAWCRYMREALAGGSKNSGTP